MPPKDQREIRSRAIDTCDFVLRAATDTTGPGFAGHAAVFNSRTSIGNPLTWGFYEQVSAGAFTKTLKESDVRFLIDHDTQLIVARMSAGDLDLREDKIGLAVGVPELDLEVSYIRDLNRNLEKKRVTGMSFGFRVVKDEWQTEQLEATDSTGETQVVDVDVRTIQEVQLFEVSAVTFPAYEDTDAGLRSAVLALAGHEPQIARRSAHTDFLTLLGEVSPEVREPRQRTRGVTEPDDGTTPAGEPDCATRGSLDVIRLRHAHLANAMRSPR